ncbi:hypothetical protein CEXT_463091 [Caerostris extrusa]|uniref:Maturase K n=1 Tax=Caerostris extrusa TaxID=172846 RepID=A0AAV4T3P4_CAEEX|nr:hypothetical protein CEXT_463091 [Caerostris extrusa]
MCQDSQNTSASDPDYSFIKDLQSLYQRDIAKFLYLFLLCGRLPEELCYYRSFSPLEERGSEPRGISRPSPHSVCYPDC